MQSIETKLKQLRKEWEANPQNRELILRRVKALKYSQTPYQNKTTAANEKLVGDVIDNLI